MYEHLIFQYLNTVPLLLVCGAGIILAIINWGKNPRAALLTAIALAILLLEHLMMPLLYHFTMGADIWVHRGVGCCVFTTDAICWGLVLFALFGPRKPPSA